MKITKEIRKRVDAGVAFLNVVMPNWLKKIKSSELDLGDGATCVIGELYGGFSDGVSELGLSNGAINALGFDVPTLEKEYSRDYDADYEVLTRAWLEKIKKLKNEKNN
jgi:hypothetical protein